MAFCGTCGATLSQGTSFCGSCGQHATSPTQPAAAPPTTSATTSYTKLSATDSPQHAAATSSAPSWLPVSTQPPQNQGWSSASAPTPVPTAAATPPWSAPVAESVPVQSWNSEGTAAPAVAVVGTGLTPNIAGALAYSLGIITGILFLVLEPYRRDRFVRFHAMQSILYFVAAVAFNILWSIMVGFLISISGWIVFVSLPLRLLISLGFFGLWLFLMFQAYNQREFRIPILGAIAARQAGSQT
jgi:uncharacterized membrane protein